MKLYMSVNDKKLHHCERVETLRGAKARAKQFLPNQCYDDIFKVWSYVKGKAPKLLATKHHLCKWRNQG